MGPALQGDHGPARADGRLLRFADGTLYHSFGTTCYAWAHQDQATSPWQAVMLLNPPSEFDGGAFYVTDAAKQPLEPLEVSFKSEGDVVIFAANSNEPRGRHLYHGMTEVAKGQRFAVGMFQTKDEKKK